MIKNREPAAANRLRPASLITGPPPPIFFYPERTRTVSVSGGACALNCEHCRGHFLQNMTPLKEVPPKSETDNNSLLISGGCDKNGQVYLPSKEDLAWLQGQGPLNFHVTLLDRKGLDLIEPYAHTISHDLHGSDRVIKKVLGLKNHSFLDYAHSYKRVWSRTRVIPHILIGLEGTDFSGEKLVIKLLEEYPPPAVVFLVYMPRLQSPLLPSRVPNLEAVLEFLQEAQRSLAGLPLILGCMRPGGKYRVELDRGALALDFAGIVHPAIPGENPIISEECCALWEW